LSVLEDNFGLKDVFARIKAVIENKATGVGIFANTALASKMVRKFVKKMRLQLLEP
jgi:hypothetical protein